MLESIVWILVIGFFAGQLARRVKLPVLVGMMLAGIALGPEAGNVIRPEVLDSANALRVIAVMVILMKAGLGLDREKLAQQGTVALRLGILPAVCEAIAIMVAARFIFQFDFLTGLLLGCVISAESPAVIVPGMLRLKRLGWGVKKGIPDAILTGSALSNVLMLLMFSLLLAFLSHKAAADLRLPGGIVLNALQILPFQVMLQIGLGLALGWITARCVVSLLTKQRWTQNAVQDTLVVASLALGMVVLAEDFPIFSGYLAMMSMGFFLVALDAPLARRLRSGFDSLWIVAEIFLFVLLGASIQLQALEAALLPGLLVLGLGTFLGRSLGWYLSTLGSNWTWQERLYLLPGNSAKATVQAAVGAIPLASGIQGGETILAIAILSILVTAPLSAWAIPALAPKLLERGEVDPTKVAIARRIRILAAVDTSSLAVQVLTKTAALARRSDSQVLVLHVLQSEDLGKDLGKDFGKDLAPLEILKETIQKLLADVRHQVVVMDGVAPEAIVQTAQDYQADEIVIGKRSDRTFPGALIGSVSRAVLDASPIPVVVVDEAETAGQGKAGTAKF